MNIPTILNLVGSLAERMSATIADFQKAVEEKHIWNTDYQSGKDFLARCCEGAVDKLWSAQREEQGTNYQRPQWEPGDPRWYVIYHPQFSNMPGAVKKLQKYKDTPQVAAMLPLFIEIAQVTELVKSVKPFIEKGRKPNPNAKPVDRTNTGTCAICRNNQKLNAEQGMVHHGYQISDGYGHYFGFRSGSCFGVGRKPYELSSEANVEYKKVLVEHRGRMRKRLASLKSGEVTEITRMEQEYKSFGQRTLVSKTYRVGDEKWADVLGYETRQVEGVIRQLDWDIETQTTYIKEWKLMPLPFGGKKEKK